MTKRKSAQANTEIRDSCNGDAPPIKVDEPKIEAPIIEDALQAAQVGSHILEPVNVSESFMSDTERMRTALNLKRSQLRVLLSDTLVNRSMPVLSKLLDDAESGVLKPCDTIKLMDLLMKYSVGMVQATEVTGEDGGAVKVQYLFGTSADGKGQALSYLQELKDKHKNIKSDLDEPIDAEFE